MSKRNFLVFVIICLTLFDFGGFSAHAKKKKSRKQGKAVIAGLSTPCNCPRVCKPTVYMATSGQGSSSLGKSFALAECQAPTGLKKGRNSKCKCSNCECVAPKKSRRGENYLCSGSHCPIGKCGCAIPRSCDKYKKKPNNCPCKDAGGTSWCSQCANTLCHFTACKCFAGGGNRTASVGPQPDGTCPSARSKNFAVRNFTECGPNGY